MRLWMRILGVVSMLLAIPAYTLSRHIWWNEYKDQLGFRPDAISHFWRSVSESLRDFCRTARTPFFFGNMNVARK